MKQKIKTLKTQLAHGVSPAMATPLQADGHSVNTAVIPQLVNFLIDAGIKGLFVGGTTGEGILLDVPERQKLHHATATAVNGRVPLLLHVGANRTDQAVTLAQHAATLNVAAIAAVTPSFYSLNDDALATYFETVAQAAPALPLLLYDIPHMAINTITPTLITHLTQTIPSLAGIKTSNLNAQQIRRQIDAVAEHHIVLAGNESIALGSLALGADGLISGMSTAIPEPFVALTKTFSSGNIEAARKQQRQINQILSFIPSGTRIGCIKQLLAERGIDVGTAVPPRIAPPAVTLWPRIREYLP